MTKRILNSMFVVSLIILQTKAQIVNEKRHYVSLSGGASAPLGLYASVDPKTDNSGLAKTGYFATAEGGVFFIPYVGMGANVGTFINPVDESAFKSASLMPSASGTIGKWKNTFFMFGPCFAIPTKSITVDFKLFFGLLTSKTPEVTLRNNYYGSTLVVTQPSVSSSSLGVNLGMGVRVNLVSNLALKFSLDLVNAQPAFTSTATATYMGQRNSISNSFNQSIIVVNAGIGLAYQFVK